MPLYLATKPLEIRVAPEKVIEVAPFVPFNLAEEIGIKIERSELFQVGIIQRHAKLIDKETIDNFKLLGIAVLFESAEYGPIWLIPNEDTLGQVGLDAVTVLPEELEFLQAMKPDQLKGVFLVKKQFSGAKILDNKIFH